MEVFSTSFLGPVDWYSTLMRLENVVIDLGEHYVKQTHRNRTAILTSNGTLQVVIPIKKSHLKSVKDIEISYTEDWQTKTLRAIRSSYLNSPYFEHFQEEFEALLMTREPFLYKYNMSLHNWIIQQLDLKMVIDYSFDYIETNSKNDHRNCVIKSENIRPYKQVFSHKFGFTPGLSIIDLLFNKGPESMMVLK